MTIFPTHKTELKTKLPRHDVLKRLVHNDFYAWGFNYKLDKIKQNYILKPVRKPLGPRNAGVPVIRINIIPQTDGTDVKLSFTPFTGVSIFLMVWLSMALAMQILIIAMITVPYSFTIIQLLPTFIAGIFYLIFLIIFSVEVISIRKQIEEHIEAEPEEVKEPSKLQDWYEKDREPFKFRNKK